MRVDGVAAATALFAPAFREKAHETLCVAHLDGERRLIGLRLHDSHLCNAITFPMRALVRDALLLDSAGLVIGHNHPSGDPAPSRQDLISTRTLAGLMRRLNVRLLDHLIFAGDDWRSMCAMGLL
ncbi:JAB domain-containing protein [Sphingomonas profundi]|uniref:JAB domain-containing protein n=1 Tax=Alterirhizorhabdus profundi TaxID=2681549 RepID=UPI0018D0DE02|nr:JAB domain-containing protein [Sphingomonas profundi]